MPLCIRRIENKLQNSDWKCFQLMRNFVTLATCYLQQLLLCHIWTRGARLFCFASFLFAQIASSLPPHRSPKPVDECLEWIPGRPRQHDTWSLGDLGAGTGQSWRNGVWEGAEGTVRLAALRHSEAPERIAAATVEDQRSERRRCRRHRQQQCLGEGPFAGRQLFFPLAPTSSLPHSPADASTLSSSSFDLFSSWPVISAAMPFVSSCASGLIIAVQLQSYTAWPLVGQLIPWGPLVSWLFWFQLAVAIGALWVSTRNAVVHRVICKLPYILFCGTVASPYSYFWPLMYIIYAFFGCSPILKSSIYPLSFCLWCTGCMYFDILFHVHVFNSPRWICTYASLLERKL